MAPQALDLTDSRMDGLPDIAPLSVGPDDSTELSYPDRTIDYNNSLPYPAESEDEATEILKRIVIRLCKAAMSQDIHLGVHRATYELDRWMEMKHTMPTYLHVQLVRLYYELLFVPGIEHDSAQYMLGTFESLALYRRSALKREHVTLDWKPLWRLIRLHHFQSGSERGITIPSPLSIQEIHNLAHIARLFFDPEDRTKLFDLITPYFTMYSVDKALGAVAYLRILQPHWLPLENRPDMHPQRYLPTLFYLWSTFSHTRAADVQFFHFFCQISAEMLESDRAPYSEFGIFTEEQSTELFTSILRFLCLYRTSTPYYSSAAISHGVVMSMPNPDDGSALSDIAWMIVLSLSPLCETKENSIFKNLEVLIQTVKPFYHPSLHHNSLADLVVALCEYMAYRWAREQSGELLTPPEKRLTRPMIRRFVLLVRDLPLIGIFSKSTRDEHRALHTLDTLSQLEPTLVLPRALRLIYPALQDSSPAHRTKSCIKALSAISQAMTQTKGFRCHIPFLLGLLLPAIDPNDPSKTRRTLIFIQMVSQLVPLYNLQKEHKKRNPDYDYSGDEFMAQQWFQGEMERFENAPNDFELDYDNELTDEQEERILRQTTAGLEEYVHELINKLFSLVENVEVTNHSQAPDKTEMSITGILGPMSQFLFFSMSPELFETVLDTISRRIHDWSLQHVRLGVPAIVAAAAITNPVRTLEVLLPPLLVNIRTEVTDNGAGTTLGYSDDILPRDQRLVYYLRIFSRLFTSGWAVELWVDQVREIIDFLLEKCIGTMVRHVTAAVGRIISALTAVRPKDYFLLNPDVVAKGISSANWGTFERPKDIKVEWHVPTEAQLKLAVGLSVYYGRQAVSGINALMGPNPPISRETATKLWSDSMTSKLAMIREICEGFAWVVDPRRISGHASRDEAEMAEIRRSEDPASKPNYEDKYATENWSDIKAWDKATGAPLEIETYLTGALLDPGSDEYEQVHEIRFRIGVCIHNVHRYLYSRATDDFKLGTMLNHVIALFLTDAGLPRYGDLLRRSSQLYMSNRKRFRLPGVRKKVPRPAVIQRMFIHYLQRRLISSEIRHRSALDIVLTNDMVCSSIFSQYRHVRLHAQHLIGFPSLTFHRSALPILHRLVGVFEMATARKDMQVLKGVMHTMMLPRIEASTTEDWSVCLRVVRTYLKTFDLDQTVDRLPDLVVGLFRTIDEIEKHDDEIQARLVRLVTGDDSQVKAYAQARRNAIKEERKGQQQVRVQAATELTNMLRQCRNFGYDLADDATEWPAKKINNLLAALSVLDLDFNLGTADRTVDVIVKSFVSSEPSVREFSGHLMDSLLDTLHEREMAGFSRDQRDRGEIISPNWKSVPIDASVSNFTDKFLAEMNENHEPEYFMDQQAGWLVWPSSIILHRADAIDREYPEVDERVRARVGTHITTEWFMKLLTFAKIEPLQSNDRVRETLVRPLAWIFTLMNSGITTLTLGDVQSIVASELADGSDKNNHRVQAEIMSALIRSVRTGKSQTRAGMWEYAISYAREAFSTKTRSEVLDYWFQFLSKSMCECDFRKFLPIIEMLTNVPVNAGPDEMLAQQAMLEGAGGTLMLTNWYIRSNEWVEPLVFEQLTNPYKAIRVSISLILRNYVRKQYFPSFPSVSALFAAQQDTSLGQPVYQPPDHVRDLFFRLLDKLNEWRETHEPNQTEPTEYRRGAKTVVDSLRHIAGSAFCPIVRDLLMSSPLFDHLLFMIDIKEDPELCVAAADMFFSLPLLPFRAGQESQLVSNLVLTARTATSWHHRMHVLALIPPLHYHRQFILPEDQKQLLFDTVTDMLSDNQVDVRKQASKALTAMVQAMPLPRQTNVIALLQARLGAVLLQRPSKRSKNLKRHIEEVVTPTSPAAARETAEAESVRKRHGAVLGLGSLLLAFPFASPPPRWMPVVLDILATRALADGNMVSRSAKSLLAEFRKTRQDTWFMDSKAFTAEELVNLEGVVQVSYFA